MNFQAYVRFLRGKWEVLAAFTLIGVTVAMGLVLTTPPKFSATSELFLSTPGYSSVGSLATSESSPYAADEFSQQRARTYVQLASRLELARRVTEKLKLNMSPEELVAATSALVQPDTVLVEVSVKSTSPVEAKVLTDAVTAELANDIRALEMPVGIRIPNVDPVVTQPASVPTKPNEPNVAIYLIFGAGIGFLAGLTVAALPRRRRAVGGPEAIEKLSGRPVLGTFRAGSDDAERVADWWVIQHEVNAQLNLLDGKPSHGGAAAGVVAVASAAKGAPDAGAVAAELAAAFARNGTRVLLVATDGYGAADTAGGDAASTESRVTGLAGVLAGESSLEDAIQSANDGSLNFLNGPGPDNPTPMLQSDKFRELFDELRATFPLIIVYSSDFFGQMETTLLKDVVDYAILALSSKSTARRSVSNAVQLVDRWDVKLVGTVLNSGSRGLDPGIQRQTLVESMRGDSA